MQPAASDKTFHLKWNNHLQNLSQLFSAIYTSSALADVTLSCRDGAIRAHKLVLSACSPYFEQIFRDNPCKHPVIILKGIPYAEINLLVEFMYKGSVDVQEIDLQSLMHTASELEVRGLAYELRKDASSLLNINLNEYPAYTTVPSGDTATGDASSTAPFQSNMDRLQQIHLYQQSMCRNAPYSTDPKRKRKHDESMTPNATNAVKSILAAAAKELAEKKDTKHLQQQQQRIKPSVQTEDDGNTESEGGDGDEPSHNRDTRFKGKKRVSIGEEFTITSPKNRPQGGKSVKFSDSYSGDCDDVFSNVKISVMGGESAKRTPTAGILKCVSFNNLKEVRGENNSVTLIEDEDSSNVDTSDDNNQNADNESGAGHEEDYDSSDSKTGGQKAEAKIYKCDLCTLSYGRKNHMMRHRRSHAGDRPFKCDQCSYSFSRSSHLARHRRTHTGERPYRCEACGRTFTRGDKLKLHLRICEKDEYVLPSHLANTIDDPSKNVKKESSQTVMSGMVSAGHSERHQLMFTSGGEVMLAPRGTPQHPKDPLDLNSSGVSELNESGGGTSLSDISAKLNMSGLMGTPSTSEAMLANQYFHLDAAGFPIKRGRGRPRKKPLPITVPLIKKKRGRPPKVIKMDPNEPTTALVNRPMENYNVSNLPYGDFTYLTDILSTHFNQSNQQSQFQSMMQLNPLIDANKLAALMANAAIQNAAGMMNADKLKMHAVKVMNQQQLQPQQQQQQQQQQPIVINSIKSVTNDERENAVAVAARQQNDVSSDPVEDTGGGGGGITEAEVVETLLRVGECHVSKVPLVSSNNSSSNDDGGDRTTDPQPIVASIGDCTIEPVAKSD